MKTVLLITTSPHHHQHVQALAFTKEALARHEMVQVFFYGDGAYVANRLMWQTANVVSVADQWIELACQYGLRLPVCVGTALARGITDADNASRHGLEGENLRDPFCLVGLSDLALLLDDDTTLIQY